MSYHEHTDHDYAKHIRAGAPKAFNAFAAWDSQVMRGADKVIPRKYTELMAVAVALTTQCPYCIEAHAGAAHSAGANQQEPAETIMIAAALRCARAAVMPTASWR
ncbi:carboxymuconolactone decarboxylase family protein [Actinacidiphila glaucinigra]|uniref:carboxymuconolactone decarboxylase family protein n=1 Tax=Actinacidiphila glaucinigra TaxID=235986 RepID=UPI0036E80FA2